jgi:hypothetical protein
MGRGVVAGRLRQHQGLAPLWEGEPFELLPRDVRVPGLAIEIAALQKIFLINERAHFEFAVTEASLREVVARNDRGYPSGSTTSATAGWRRPKARSRWRGRPSAPAASTASV